MGGDYVVFMPLAFDEVFAAYLWRYSEEYTYICVFSNDNQDFIEKASQHKNHILRGYKK